MADSPDDSRVPFSQLLSGIISSMHSCVDLGGDYVAHPFIVPPVGARHPAVDLDALMSYFAESNVAAFLAQERRQVSGPCDVFSYEAKRSGVGGPTEDAVLVNLFLWGVGEPAHQSHTKLGGLPYMPRAVEWPAPLGVSARFVGQLSFVDSRELVPDLPGDVLLVFDTRWNEVGDGSLGEDPENLFEACWVRLGDFDLVSADDVPEDARWSGQTHHGVRCLSYDDLALWDRIDEKQWWLPEIEATKIGGYPTDLQPQLDMELPEDYLFLGQLAQSYPAVHAPYPVTNRADVIPDRQHPEGWYSRLSGGPPGVLGLYLRPDGSVFVDQQLD